MGGWKNVQTAIDNPVRLSVGEKTTALFYMRNSVSRAACVLSWFASAVDRSNGLLAQTDRRHDKGKTMCCIVSAHLWFYLTVIKTILHLSDINNISDTIKNSFSVDKKNQLDVTFCILYFSSNSCSTCFGQPCAHHQELTTTWCYSLVLVCAVVAGRLSRPVGSRCHFLYSLFLF